jgi:tRNA threonylcarbamoyladenosine biosynthesis protein TsaB
VPPRVLAIDTTAATCSVAFDGVRRALPMVHGHSRHVLPLVAEVMAEAGAGPSAVDAIGFGSGPGAFTGLRIACGVAQGLAFGWDRPVVAVDAMRTLAWQAAHDEAAVLRPCALVCVALDVRMGEVCRAAFELEPLRSDRWPNARLEPAIVAPQAALFDFDRLGPSDVLLAGDGYDRHPALTRWTGDRPRPAGARQPDAAAVAALAAIGLCAGRAVDAAAAAPWYLRDKVALDVDEQAALRAARTGGAGR